MIAILLMKSITKLIKEYLCNMGAIQNSMLHLITSAGVAAHAIGSQINTAVISEANDGQKNQQKAEEALENMKIAQQARKAVNDRIAARRANRQNKVSAADAGKAAAEAALARRRQNSNVIRKKPEVE